MFTALFMTLNFILTTKADTSYDYSQIAPLECLSDCSNEIYSHKNNIKVRWGHYDPEESRGSGLDTARKLADISAASSGSSFSL